MPGLTENLHLLTPEFALAGLAFAVFAADLLLPDGKKERVAWLSIAGLLGLIAVSLVMLWGEDKTLYDGLLAVDGYSLFFKVFFMGLGVFIILSSIDYVRQYLENPGEFYGLLLLSILGMNLLAQSRELLTAYISLELLSFSLYVLTAYARSNAKSNEAGLKYIIIGAFSSAILLYGVSMVYSTLGVTRFADISVALATVSEVSPALWVGVAFILVGLGFKISVVPFHMWAPDVYEGAPLPITAYLAIGSKAAAFALILRLVAEGFVPATDRWDQWQIIVAVLSAVTMLVGNLVALAQRNIKRLMAYSSIGHVGIILSGVAALSSDSTLASNGIMLYLVGYSVTNLVVFAGLIAFFNMTGREMISDFGGLAGQQPFLAASIAIGMFSLGGLPIFAGFTIKFYLFTAVAEGGFLWLASLAIFSSLIALYYYLQVIRQMYIQPALAAPVGPDETDPGQGHGNLPIPPLQGRGRGDFQGIPAVPVGPDEADTSPPSVGGTGLAKAPSALMLVVLAVGLAAVIWIGVYPSPLLEAIEAASQAILPGV
jgi:NADH-quinone oxidoreductase subunit N